MELEWRNRSVGGERLEDLCGAVMALEAEDDADLFDRLWDDDRVALPLHRALLRIAAELLWQRAATLAPWRIIPHDDYGSLLEDAYDELLRRAGLEFGRAGRIPNARRDTES
jgi:hypothetical protein